MKNILFKLYWNYLDYSSFIVLFLKRYLSKSSYTLIPSNPDSSEPNLNNNIEAIVLVPELNWELELINEIDKKFLTHIYRGIESKGFFKHRSEWQEWRSKSSKSVLNYVNSLTSKNKNKDFVFFFIFIRF